MKRASTLVFAIILSLSIIGCAQKPESANSSEAISNAKKLETVEAQVDYLVKEANAFVSSKEYKEAMNTAQYVLSNLEKESLEAKKVLEKAKAELEAAAKKAAEDVKKGLSDSMKNIGQ